MLLLPDEVPRESTYQDVFRLFILAGTDVLILNTQTHSYFILCSNLEFDWQLKWLWWFVLQRGHYFCAQCFENCIFNR
jgi:hypothetical protein